MLNNLEVVLSKVLPMQTRMGSPLKKTNSMGNRASRENFGI